ncbi:MAG TPA: hypothetical protein VNC11_12845 [Gemmatimonadaceae bacterium]|jgi:hypothetical protein|nr:hypothetical protein [Gemmatimonadaceae bacterium]
MRITQRHATLVIAACLLPGCSDSTPPNASDHVEASVGPSGATVVTPTGAAGLQIPPGALNQTVTVSISQIATPGTPATGPLPTNLKQYGPYYEIQTSPANVQFGDSVRVGVCQVTDPSSAYYAPEADHSKLKLAHTVNGVVEILKPVAVTDFLHCTGVQASVDQKGWRGSLSRLLSGAHVSVAYAAHGGLGGKVKSFSPFGAVLDACGDSTALTFGVTASGTIERTDCEMVNLAPAPVSGDIFKFSLGAQSTFRVTPTGAAELQIRIEQIGQPSEEKLVSEIANPISEYMILPAGNYAMVVHNRSLGDATEKMPYTLTLQTVAAVTGCPTNQSQQTYIYPGTVVNGSVASDDCPTTVQGLFGDNYWIWMSPSRTYQFSTTSNIGIRLELTLCCSSTLPVRFASSGPGTVSMTYQPPSTGLYVLNVIGNTISAPTGPYTLTVTKQ